MQYTPNAQSTELYEDLNIDQQLNWRISEVKFGETKAKRLLED